MADLAKSFVREPAVDTAKQYAERVRTLTIVYLLLFLVPIIGIVLIIGQARFLITLTQRSNVETLTLLFLLIFFAYFILLSARGARGALQICWYWLRARLGDAEEVERAKLAALGPPSGTTPEVVLNVILERSDRPREPFEIPVRDRFGSMGTIVVDGARLRHAAAPRDGSNDLLAFFTHRVAEIAKRRGHTRRAEIVAWRSIDDEAAEQFAGLVEFARNLERRLGGDGELWPKIAITPAECAEIEQRTSEICPTLRNEAFLPDWEFTGEHKLPLIPEPLGLLSLTRQETRTDPIASMGCAALVVIVATVVVAIFILFPPWVPG